jgi:hypothetical protein
MDFMEMARNGGFDSFECSRGPVPEMSGKIRGPLGVPPKRICSMCEIITNNVYQNDNGCNPTDQQNESSHQYPVRNFGNISGFLHHPSSPSIHP